MKLQNNSQNVIKLDFTAYLKSFKAKSPSRLALKSRRAKTKSKADELNSPKIE